MSRIDNTLENKICALHELRDETTCSYSDNMHPYKCMLS